MILPRAQDDLHERSLYVERVCDERPYLIIDIRNVHDEMNIVAKIVYHDPAQDILCHIVPTE